MLFLHGPARSRRSSSAAGGAADREHPDPHHAVLELSGVALELDQALALSDAHKRMVLEMVHALLRLEGKQ